MADKKQDTEEKADGVKSTTTTTQEARDENLSETTTLASGPAPMAEGDKQGEVAIDEGAESHRLQEQSVNERLDSAKEDALRNHQAEHSGDDADYETLINVNKVEDNNT